MSGFSFVMRFIFLLLKGQAQWPDHLDGQAAELFNSNFQNHMHELTLKNW